MFGALCSKTKGQVSRRPNANECSTVSCALAAMHREFGDRDWGSPFPEASFDFMAARSGPSPHKSSQGLRSFSSFRESTAPATSRAPKLDHSLLAESLKGNSGNSKECVRLFLHSWQVAGVPTLATAHGERNRNAFCDYDVAGRARGLFFSSLRRRRDAAGGRWQDLRSAPNIGRREASSGNCGHHSFRKATRG